jgi:hypothetical protein
MLQINNTIVSDDVITKKFVCDLKSCKGVCCIFGDSGAPIEKEEIESLKKEFQNIIPFMRHEGINAVEKNGFYYTDSEFDTVTMLIEGKECAYTFMDEHNIAYCAIEKAFLQGKTSFRKPISCRLYPLRVKHLKELIAVNHNEWEICNPAVILGEKLGIYVYRFLKEALIEKFGKDWFDQLQYYVDSFDKKT